MPLERSCSEVGVALFSHTKNDRSEGNGLELWQGRFRLDIKKKFFTERVIKNWNKFSTEAVESSSLEVFKRCMDLAFRDIIWCWSSLTHRVYIYIPHY